MHQYEISFDNVVYLQSVQFYSMEMKI